MIEIRPENAPFVFPEALTSWLMETNALLWVRVKRLINLGMNQKAVAGYMQIPASTFSKWLNQRSAGVPSLNALDGFQKLLDTLRTEIDLDVAAMSEEEQKRLRAEMESLKTAHVIRAKKRKSGQRRVGKEVAKR